MAIIKDGNGGTDQASVNPVSKALRVILYDANGNANSVPLATSTTGALELNGNLQSLRVTNTQALEDLLGLILVEIRLQNEILANGLNLGFERYERYREDRAFTQVDVVNG